MQEVGWWKDMLEWCNKNQGFITLLAMLISLGAIGFTSQFARKTLQQNAKNHHDANRPVMVARLRLDTINQAFMIAVTNYGKSPARNVRLIFPPGFGDHETEFGATERERAGYNLPGILARKYALTTYVWGPNEERLDYYCMYPQTSSPKDVLPDNKVTVTIRYDDLDQSYEDAFLLDLEPLDFEARWSLLTKSSSDVMLEELAALRVGVEGVKAALDRISPNPVKVTTLEDFLGVSSSAVSKDEADETPMGCAAASLRQRARKWLDEQIASRSTQS